MKTQALLFASDPAYRVWLNGCVGDDVTILPADAQTPHDSVAEVADTPDVGLVFVQFTKDTAAGQADIVERLGHSYPALAVIAVGDREDGECVLAAMRAGARDFFVLGHDDDKARSLLSRVLSRSRGKASERGEHDGELMAVLSCPQTPGAPFLAAHIALALESAREQKQRVLLLDLSLPGGSGLVLLDGAHDYTAAEALRDVDRCDETLVGTAFQRVDGGVYLLGLPEMCFTAADLPTADLPRLLDKFRTLFDYTVVCADAGLGLDTLSGIVDASAHSVLVTDQSVLRSRQNKAMLRALRARETDLRGLRLVVDNYHSDLGLEAERLAELLDLPLATCLTGRSAVRIRAMNAGRSMFEQAPADSYTRGVTALVQQLLGVATQSAMSRGVVSRLFGRG